MRTEHTPWMGGAVSAVLLLLLPLLSSAVDVPPVELTPGSSSNLRQQQQSGRNRTRIEQETAQPSPLHPLQPLHRTNPAAMQAAFRSRWQAGAPRASQRTVNAQPPQCAMQHQQAAAGTAMPTELGGTTAAGTTPVPMEVHDEPAHVRPGGFMTLLTSDDTQQPPLAGSSGNVPRPAPKPQPQIRPAAGLPGIARSLPGGTVAPPPHQHSHTSAPARVQQPAAWHPRPLQHQDSSSAAWRTIQGARHVPYGAPIVPPASSDAISAAYDRGFAEEFLRRHPSYARRFAQQSQQHQQQQHQQQQAWQQQHQQQQQLQQQQLHSLLATGQGVTGVPATALPNPWIPFAAPNCVGPPHVLWAPSPLSAASFICPPFSTSQGVPAPPVPSSTAAGIGIAQWGPPLLHVAAVEMAPQVALIGLAQHNRLANNRTAPSGAARRARPEAAGGPPQHQPGVARAPAAPAAPAAPTAAALHPFLAEQLPRVVTDPLYKAALQQQPQQPQQPVPQAAAPAQLDIGSRSETCRCCRAKLWPAEVKADGTGGRLCCNHGKACNISTLWPQPAPQPLKHLMTADPAQDADARAFQQNLRKYNTLLQMASSGIKLSNPPTGISMLAIRGGIYHMLPTLQPTAGQPAQYAQLYIVDDQDQQVAQRLAALNLHQGAAAAPAPAADNFNVTILRDLQQMLHTNNSYVRQYKQVLQLNAAGLPQYDFVFLTDGTPDKRRYNAPTASEVAGILPGTGDQPTLDRRIAVMPANSTRPSYVPESNGAYDPLHFVLLHPRGEHGWHTNSSADQAWAQHRHQQQQQRRQPAPQQQQAEDGAEGEQDQAGRRRRAQPDITPREYATYFMHDREPADNFLMVRGKRLYQEWAIDQYCKVEGERLQYLRTHQHAIRADVYRGLADAMHEGDANLEEVGRAFVLPSSFVGGPRHMAQLYQDAMSIVRAKGKPDLFITVTCNPHWPEIGRELKPGETANDRFDLLARVFRIKLDCLLKDLLQHGVFGRVVGDIHVVEYQKRGMPHAHLLIILHPDDKLRNVDDYDRVVSACLPEPHAEPNLYMIVTRHMIHGPCGSINPTCPCMQEGACSKQYPKQFCEATVDLGDHYPAYRRPNDGRTFRTPKGPVDNRWVVPYNPWLLQKYNCHINVEVCATVAAVKYLYKYVYKGHDRAQINVQAVGPDAGAAPGGVQRPQARDELKEFVEGRYVSASEACWRLSAFDMHAEHPNVVRLAVHVDGAQAVYFDPQNRSSVEAVLARGEMTTLTAWFKYNKQAKDAHAEACAAAVQHGLAPPAAPECLSVLYHDFPKICVFNHPLREWRPRQPANASRGLLPVGRMYTVHPSQQERYFLRMLLCHVPGASCYADMLANPADPAHPFATFKDACAGRGLLRDDAEWRLAMQDAKLSAHPAAMRELFASLLHFNGVERPAQLWEEFKADMCDDYLHEARRVAPDRPFDADIWDRALREIERLLLQLTHGAKGLADFGLPMYARGTPVRGMAEEELLLHPRAEAAQKRDAMLPQLNPQQREVYDGVVGAALNGTGNHTAFFIDGVGGSGKTFLYEVMLHAVRAEGKIAIPVASSGIAALLLDGGRTAHSRFKIAVEGLDDNSTCGIATRSQLAAFIQQAALIVWDEAPMLHRWTFEAVDRTLRDLMGAIDAENKHKLFGGKVVVMGGDFRQVLPVVKRGSRADIVGATLNQSRRIWPEVHLCRLHENMRVARLQREGDAAGAQELRQFAEYLKRLGEGAERCYPTVGADCVLIPPCMLCSGGANATVRDLVKDVYGGLDSIADESLRTQFITERAILTPLTEHVDLLNKHIMSSFEFKHADGSVSQPVVCKSADGLVEGEQVGNFPTEFLNTLNFSGWPPHQLHLRVGCPIILLRNMTGGLANGTRMILTGIRPRVLEAVVAVGPMKGRFVFIPRIEFTLSETEGLPFTMCRRQFPVRAAFAMTVNKSQGQTLKAVGVFLPKPVFSHGQLYVAFSRVGSPSAIKVLVPGGCQRGVAGVPDGVYTKNVVYTEVFRGVPH